MHTTPFATLLAQVNNTDSFGIAMALTAAMMVAIGFAIWYLNRSRDTQTDILMRYLKPYQLFFNTINKNVYAMGQIGSNWIGFNIHRGRRDTSLIKMRIRIDLPNAPRFYFCTEHAAGFLHKHSGRNPSKWPHLEGKYYIQSLDKDLTPQRVLDAMQPTTREFIEDFERRNEGVVLYSIDAALFSEADRSLVQSNPELEHELVLFTHIVVGPGLPTDLFKQFVDDSIKMAELLQSDLKVIYPEEEGSKRKAAKLKKL